MIYGGTAVLAKSNIQNALVKTPMLNSLQATAIIVELYCLETVIRAAYQNPNKYFAENDFDKSIRLSKSRNLVFGATSVVSTRIRTLD